MNKRAGECPGMNKRAGGQLGSSSPPSGCRSRPTGSSRRRRACWRAPRACTTGRPTAARCSTAPPACGASTPATAGRRSSRRCSSRSAQMDFAPTFQMGHPMAFEFAERLARDRAERLLARVLHQLGLRVGRHRAQDRARLPPRARRRPALPPDRPRARLPRRQLRRHGGRRHHRQQEDASGPGVAGVDHIRHTHDPARNAFSKGQPKHGVEFADELERLCALHDPVDHRRGDRRAGGRLGRRAGAAGRATSSACARSARSTASC